MDILTPEFIVQGGGLGLAALTIGAWAKYVFNHQKHMQQAHKESMDVVVGVVKENTGAMTKMSGLVEQDIETTKELKQIIQRK